MLLINPSHSFSWHRGVSLSLGYLASALEADGKEVEIFDCQIIKDYEDKILQALKKHTIVGISINVGIVSSGLEIAKLIRKNSPSTKIIMGGPHATAIYDKLIPKYADIVVIGEGERTIVELADSRPLKDIQGIAYWDSGLKLTPKRPLIENLDSLDFPAFHLYDLKNYKMPGFRTPMGPLITSRGCPHQCIFCASVIVHGRRLRLRSVENIMKEIDCLVEKFKVREILIEDDCFGFYPQRVKEICRRIIKKRYRDLHFRAYDGIRPDMCDPEMFNLMRQAGFYYVRLGIESGSKEILRKTNKELDLQKTRQTIGALREAGIKVSAFFILGFPFDTNKTMQETIDFARSLYLEKAIFTIASPFPGTELHSMIKESGRILRDLNFQSENRRTVCYETKDLKAKDVEETFLRAYRQFYFRPRQILRIVKSRELGYFVSVAKMLFRANKKKSRQEKHI